MSAPETALFSTACGMTAPLELEVAAPRRLCQRHTIACPWVVLGRDPRAALHLDDASVSRRHAYLQILGGRLFAVDLGSRRGLGLGDAAVLSGWVDPGRPLLVGAYRVEVVAPSPASLPAGREGLDPLEDRSPEFEDGSRAYFDIHRGGKRLAKWRMNRALALIGSSERCRIRLNDGSVSRTHSSLVATPEGAWVVDLLSRTGTRVGGKVVPFARLRDGDTLQVGDYELRVRLVRPGPGRPAGQAAGLEVPRPPRPPQSASPAPSPFLVLGPGKEGLMVPAPGTPPDTERQLLVPLVQQFTALQQQMFDQFSQTMGVLIQMLSSMHQEQASLLREEMKQFQKATEELNRLQQQAREGQAPAAAPAPPTPSRWAPGTWPGARPQAPDPSAAEEPLAALPAPAEGGGPRENADGEEAHAWLHDRIAELQAERQNSWKRLLGFIRGS